MSTSTPAPMEQFQHSQPAEWDIVPVCDIRLGQLFKFCPELQDTYVDIDTEAVSASLHRLNPAAAGGTIVLKAVHDKSLEIADPSDKFDGSVGLTHLNRKTGEITVSVSLGGGLMALGERLCDEMDNGRPDPVMDNFRRGYLASNPVHTNGKTSKQLEEQVIAAAALFAQEASLFSRTPDQIHTTAVHELQHATDFRDKVMYKAERRYIYRNTAQSLGSIAFGMIGVSYASFKALSVLRQHTMPDNDSKALRTATVALSLAAGNWLGHKLTKPYAQRIDNRGDTKSPLEKRAYMAEKQANTFPPLISFLPLS